MPYPNANLSHFRQLREQAVKKKSLEEELEQLTHQCETLSAQSDACKQAKDEAEKPSPTWSPAGPWAFSTPSPGGKPPGARPLRRT